MPLVTSMPLGPPYLSWNILGASSGSCGSKPSAPRKNGRFFFRSSTMLMALRKTRAVG